MRTASAARSHGIANRSTSLSAVSEVDEQLVHEVFARWNSGEREVDPELIDEEVEIRSALDQPARWLVRFREGRLHLLANFIGHDSAGKAAEAE